MEFLGLGLALLGGKKQGRKSFTRKAQKKQRNNRQNDQMPYIHFFLTSWKVFK